MWTGSVFNRRCARTDLVLRHSLFSDPGGAFENVSCPSGNIVGKSLSEDGSCFTSQLTFTASADFNGTNVVCIYDDGTMNTDIDRYQVVLNTGESGVLMKGRGGGEGFTGVQLGPLSW